jgi:hypothetical protein
MSNDNIRVLGDVEISSALSFKQDMGVFPSNPKPRTLVVKDGQPYIYAEVSTGSGYFSWLPVGARQNSYLHSQGVESSVWTISHNLNTTDFAYFVYDNNHVLVLANATVVDATTIQINLSEAITGTAIVFGVAHVVVPGVTAVDNVTINSIVLRDTNGVLTVNNNAVAFAGYVDSSIAAVQAELDALSPSALTSSGNDIVAATDAGATITGNLIPSANVTYSLGDETHQWKDLWLSGSTINLGGAVIKTDATTGAVAIIPQVTASTPNPVGVVISSTGSITPITTTGGVISAGAIAESTTDTTQAAATVESVTAIAASVYTKAEADTAVLTYLSNVTQDIVPDVNLGANIGSPTHMFHSVYVGPGTLYVNGKPVIQDNSDTITFSTDPDQNLRIQTAGAGHLEIQSADAGSIDIKGTLNIQSGKRIVDSAGTQVQFGDDIQMNSNKVIGLGAPLVATDATTKGYVDGLTINDLTLVRTSGVQAIAGAKTFNDDLTISGNLIVSGTTTTVNSETIKLADNLIDLNSNFVAGAPSENAGIRILRGDEAASQVRWNESSDKWEVSADSSTFSVIAVTADVTAAISTAATDATTKANAAQAAAISTAATAADAKVLVETDARIAADTAAIATAATAADAKVLVETDARVTAVSGAITTAATDATTKANAAQAAAISTAATDATTKANAAISTAATDATNKVTTETSRATAAEALLAPKNNPSFTGTVYGITKAMVGLGSADNTSDSAKPVSTAQATAISSAQSAAINAAATDATAKADAARSAAIAAAASGNSATATKLATPRSIALSGDVTGTVNFDGSAGVTIAATIAANSVALGTDTTGNYVGSGATSGNGISGSVASEGGAFTVTSNATSANTANTIVYRDASGNFSAGTMTGTSTSAKYADLAENYVGDAAIEPGTVVEFGGDAEVTACGHDMCTRVAGVVSTNPAYLMNNGLEAEHVIAVAFTGRVPCKVVGVVRKGDMMVSAGNGAARAEAEPKVGSIIGKALENFDGAEGVIEVVVGRY